MDKLPTVPLWHYLFWILPVMCAAWRRRPVVPHRSLSEESGQPLQTAQESHSQEKPASSLRCSSQATVSAARPVLAPRQGNTVTPGSAGHFKVHHDVWTSDLICCVLVGGSKISHILIHNVSHSDVVLDLNSVPPEDSLPSGEVKTVAAILSNKNLIRRIY